MLIQRRDQDTYTFSLYSSYLSDSQLLLQDSHGNSGRVSRVQLSPIESHHHETTGEDQATDELVEAWV